MQVGEVIKQLRSAAGLSQQEYAKRLEITASYLSLVETGKREPTVPLLRKMADVLGAPAALLIAAALVDGPGRAGHEQERAAVHHLVQAARQMLIANQMDLKLLHAGTEK